MAMRPRRWAWTHRYAVPMFVASLVAFVLSAAGLVTVLVLDRDGGTGPQSGIDPCVVGSWRMVEHTERLSAFGQEVQLTLVDGQSVRYEYRDDGTGSANFGGGTTFEGTSLGQEVQATIAGTMTYRYEAASGVFQVTEILTNDATFTVELFPGAPVDTPYGVSTTTPEQYRCAGDSIEFSVEERDYSARYERIV